MKCSRTKVTSTLILIHVILLSLKHSLIKRDGIAIILIQKLFPYPSLENKCHVLFFLVSFTTVGIIKWTHVHVFFSQQDTNNRRALFFLPLDIFGKKIPMKSDEENYLFPSDRHMHTRCRLFVLVNIDESLVKWSKR